MNQIPRIFGYRKQFNDMNWKKKTQRKQPKLERRNAEKNFNYDAAPSSSESSVSASILCTRSMDFYDRTSFRVEGVEGEFDEICRRLGLSGPEDFSIPAAAWEAMKAESLSENDEVRVVECEIRVPIRDSDESSPAGTSGCCGGGGEGRGSVSGCYNGIENMVLTKGLDEVTGAGGIKGFRPPVLKPPPGARVSAVVEDTSSTWDLMRNFAPKGERGGKESYVELSASDDDQEEEEVIVEEGEVDGLRLKREEEENVEIVGCFSRSCSFTTSHEDDSSSTTTDPRSNSISPNGRVKPVITPGSWQKGGLLGRGSFGSVFEGISK